MLVGFFVFCFFFTEGEWWIAKVIDGEVCVWEQELPEFPVKSVSPQKIFFKLIF